MIYRDITIRLASQGDGLPNLSDFTNLCSTLRTCLNQVARCVAGVDIEYQLGDLRQGSAILAIVPLPDSAPVTIANEVADTFDQTVVDILEGRLPDTRLDFQALRAFNGFSSIVRRGTGLDIDGIILTIDYPANMAQLLEPASPAFGTVTGRLEALTLHNNQNRFTLYPPVFGEDIDCDFARTDLRKVLDAVGKKVTVIGRLHYAKTKAFPVRVDVDDFVVELPDSELPTLLDARGILSGSSQHSDEQASLDEWD